jgi:hypothetical protein
MTQTDRRATPRALRVLRERRGWSWADQARAIKDAARTLSVTAVAGMSVSSLVRTIARWESEGGAAIPGERYRLLLAYAYACRGDDVAVAAGSDFEQLMSLMTDWGTPAERIAELRAQVVQVVTRGHALLAYLAPGEDRALGAALAAPETLTIEVVDEIRKLVDAVNAQVGSVPFARLQVALAPAVEACRILHEGNSPGPVRMSLAGVAANTFMVAARVAFETRDDQTSAHLTPKR